MLSDVDIGSGTLRSPRTTSAVDYHNDGHATSTRSVTWRSTGPSTTASRGLRDRDGASVDAIEVLKDGLVGRGVLLDIPRLRGVPGSSPASTSFGRPGGGGRDQGVRVGEGRHPAGAHRPRPAAAPSPDRGTPPRPRPGLHPTASASSRSAGSPPRLRQQQRRRPEHHRGHRLPDPCAGPGREGVHLLDYLQFEDLAPPASASGRWEFLLVVAPLRVVGGTGSPSTPSRSSDRRPFRAMLAARTFIAGCAHTYALFNPGGVSHAGRHCLGR